jgi:hypothetical protein
MYLNKRDKIQFTKYKAFHLMEIIQQRALLRFRQC